MPGGSRPARRRRRDRPYAVPALLASGLLLSAAGCAAQEPAGDAPTGPLTVELIRHGADGPSRVTLDDPCAARVPALARELLAGAAPVRLLVSEERLREVKAGGALEIVFDETRRFETTADADTRARRILLPLAGDSWVGTEERPFVTLFRGEETFGSGAYRNPDGLDLLRELEGCAEPG